MDTFIKVNIAILIAQIVVLVGFIHINSQVVYTRPTTEPSGTIVLDKGFDRRVQATVPAWALYSQELTNGYQLR